MNSSWVFLALISTIIAALVTILDSHYMTKRMPDWQAYVVLCDVFTLPLSIVMLIVIPLPVNIGLRPYFALLGATCASIVASVLILQAMKKEHVSRVYPLTSTSPVFVAVFAFLFLGERLSWLQMIGVAAIVIGAVIISLKWDTKSGASLQPRPVLVLLGAAVLIAISGTLNKYALEYMSFWNDATLLFFISSVIFLAVCVRPSVLRQIAGLKDRNFTIALAMFNQAVASVAMVLAYSAVQKGPVALVSAVTNSKPLFIFAFSMAAGRFAPNFLAPEHLNRKTLFIKAGATALVTAGLVAMIAV
jgi:drug/metabolite transporter (DMT)-like permease